MKNTVNFHRKFASLCDKMLKALEGGFMKKSDIYTMIEQWVDVWNARDIDRLKSMYAQDAILYQGPVKKALKGWEYIQARLEDLTDGFPDAQMKINNLHVDGNIAILEFNETGTHEGRFLDYEPTGNKIDFDSCLVFRVSNGKIVNHMRIPAISATDSDLFRPLSEQSDAGNFNDLLVAGISQGHV